MSVTLKDGTGATIGTPAARQLRPPLRRLSLPFSAFAANDTAKVHLMQISCAPNPSIPGGGFLNLTAIAYTGFPRRPSTGGGSVSVTLAPLPRRRGEIPTVVREIYGVNFARGAQVRCHRTFAAQLTHRCLSFGAPLRWTTI